MEKEQDGKVIVENYNAPTPKINLTINSEVLYRIKREKVNINQLFVLFACYQEALNLLDMYDDSTTNMEVLVFDYQDLMIHGFLADASTEQGISLYKLTEAGKELVEELIELMGPSDEAEQIKGLKDFCRTYRELWPNIKLPSNVYARASAPDIEKKMKSWFRVYRPYFKKEYGIKLTEQDILDATKSYIARFSKDGYKFMANSLYFIHKNDKSSLAEELLAIKTGVEKTVVQTNITGM